MLCDILEKIHEQVKGGSRKVEGIAAVQHTAMTHKQVPGILGTTPTLEGAHQQVARLTRHSN